MSASTSEAERRADARAVRLVLASRLLPLAAAPVTLALLATTRPPSEQGWYFLLANLQALTGLLEAQVGAMPVQFAAHHAPRLDWGPDGRLVGNADAVEATLAAHAESRRWYGRVALALAVAVAVTAATIGLGGGGDPGAPAVPWLLTGIATCAYARLVPWLCTIEGAGGVAGLASLQRMRTLQAAVGVACVWALLPALGAPVAVAALSVAWLVVPWVWVRRTHPGLLAQLPSSTNRPGASPSGSLARVQWHTATAMVLAWAIVQGMTPLVMATHGAEAGGRVGMGLAIATAPLTLALVVLQARLPGLAGIDRGAAGDALLRGRVREAIVHGAAVWLGLSLLVCLTVAMLVRLHPALGGRVVSPPALLAMCAAGAGWLVVHGAAAVRRARLAEPLLGVLLRAGWIVPAAIWLGAARGGADGAAIGYGLGVALGLAPVAWWTLWCDGGSMPSIRPAADQTR